jgi:hypothetical protein
MFSASLCKHFFLYYSDCIDHYPFIVFAFLFKKYYDSNNANDRSMYILHYLFLFIDILIHFYMRNLQDRANYFEF